MAKAIWDKSLIKVYMDPMTGRIEDAVNDPSWQPSNDVMGITFTSERELKMRFPNVEFTILGERLAPNNTRTIEEAFALQATPEDLMEAKGARAIDMLTPIKAPPAFKDIDSLLMLFTKAAVEARHAEGVRDKAYKKGFCNGVGKAIVTLDPSLKERLMDVISNSKDQTIEDSDSFI